ncbi:EAL domain-containing protein [Pelomonas sp. BJYL3]|uniref:EAL domain-containing protein n=1 Tax=Pelomonas sp. BJYL3 TaxID=2976697 RepID=UPI0022B58759|nr:EAL domain-containing protein [Pelomonas sp. BJYL3]
MRSPQGPGLATTRPPDLSGRWHGVWQLLSRLESNEGLVPQAFARRREHVLRVMAWLTILGSLPWAAHFLFIGRPWVAAMPGMAVAGSAFTLLLLKHRLPRTASVFYCFCAWLVVLALSLLADLPSGGVPRSTQLYLIPLFVCSYFLLQYRPGWLLSVMSVLILGAFVALQTFELRFVETPTVPLQTRQVGVGLVAVLTALLIYACIVTMLRDARQASAQELDFARGIAAGEIEPFFQAQCNAEGELIGAEVLMRWRHPKRGLVSPAEFVPIAEATGLIEPAGQRLLEQVCRLLVAWQDGGPLHGIPISINVSSIQLQSESATEKLIATVPPALAQAGLLKFELTESAYSDNFEQLQERMQRMRERGIRLALDDFGTGFSSLSRLRGLPLDQLKVDQSFVHDLPDDADACRIAETIVHLGLDMGLEVVAEGVENVRQLDCLRSMGCMGYQGHWFSRPVSAARFMALAEKWQLREPGQQRFMQTAPASLQSL